MLSLESATKGKRFFWMLKLHFQSIATKFSYLKVHVFNFYNKLCHISWWGLSVVQWLKHSLVTTADRSWVQILSWDILCMWHLFAGPVVGNLFFALQFPPPSLFPQSTKLPLGGCTFLPNNQPYPCVSFDLLDIVVLTTDVFKCMFQNGYKLLNLCYYWILQILYYLPILFCLVHVK